MIKKISINVLRNYAKKGNQIAFKNKNNAIRYQNQLRNHGYRTGTLRSYGPTIEGGYTKSYYVIGIKSKRRKK